MKSGDIEHHIEDLAARLRSRGLRRTRGLDLVVRALISSGQPLTIAELAAQPGITEECDPATVYRLLMKLEEHGMVRRLGLHERRTYFIPVLPGSHRDYLVCTQCGSIAAVDMECPVHSLERKLEKSTGFHHIYHELEFFGICPDCHDGRAHTGRTHCC